jgi:hypothetical protein
MGMLDFSLGDVGGVFTGIREAVTGKKIEDPLEQAKLMLALDQIEADLKKAQMEVNATEAQHPSIFVAGWRPFIGWAGGAAIAYNYIVQPLLYVALAANDVLVVMPVLDIGTLMILVTGMLGFGGLRSFDKKNGVSNGI